MLLPTRHAVLTADARDLRAVPDASVHLVVTSPPYPMIAMWDELFAAMEPSSKVYLERGEGVKAFKAMHRALDKVWRECYRAMSPGGFLCVNIGDATRTLAGEFSLYPNHARIISALLALGMCQLPDILWRKPNNSPNKFMGSGVLPAGAYVTYEHEYILIFRKGGKRIFSAEERLRRAWSAFFWEERNVWFSDLWANLPGTSQHLPKAARARSAAFPWELPWRLIQMYSIFGDTVLDPFAGTGTTGSAALASGRSSVCVELDPSMRPAIDAARLSGVALGRARCEERLKAHRAFLSDREPPRHSSEVYGFPVVTRQEAQLRLFAPETVTPEPDGALRTTYALYLPQISRDGETVITGEP